MEFEPIGPDKLDVEEVGTKAQAWASWGIKLLQKLIKLLITIKSWEERKQLWGPGGKGGFGEIASGHVTFQVTVHS